MDSLDAQIKALQRKKAKIQLLRDVQKYVSELKDPSDHEGLTDEVRSYFDTILNKEVLAIQSAGESRLRETRVPGETPEPGSHTPPPPAAPIKPRTDLVDFVRKYGPFGFKKVTAKTLDGDTVTGIVKSIEYPNILVESEHGGLLEVQPDTMELK